MSLMLFAEVQLCPLDCTILDIDNSGLVHNVVHNNFVSFVITTIKLFLII